MSRRSRRSEGMRRTPILACAFLAFAVLVPAAPVMASAPQFTRGPDRASLVRTGPRTPAQAREAAMGPQTGTPVLPLRSPAAATPDATSPLAEPVPSLLSYSGPPPMQIDGFSGIRWSDGCSCEPPDPWIAAGGNYLVEATNSFVRIFRRSGTQLVSVPMGAFFGIPGSEVATDPRILWDGQHNRWIGVALSFAAGFQDTYLNLAYSQSADPTATWTTLAFAYANSLPDYPGIAVSSDKVMLTANEYLNGKTFAASSLLILDWNGLLDTGTPTGTYLSSTSNATPRPAQLLSAGSDIHLITEGVSNQHAYYYRFHGPAESVQSDAGFDLTTGLGVAAFDLPPAPQQPGSPSTISTSIDERPTDAVWRDNVLWFTSTLPWSWDGGATTRSVVHLTQLRTTSGTPTLRRDVVVGRPDHDAFLSGVGISGNGTMFAPFSESSASEYVSSRVIAFVPGAGFTSQVELSAGTANYNGTRWGDYLGVAADPAGDGAVWVATEDPASDGWWQTTVRRVAIDGDLPSVTKPIQNIAVPSRLGSSVAVRLTWSGADATTGIARYRFAANVDGAGWGHAKSVTGTAIVRRIEIGHTARFRVRAIDGYGNRSPWRAGPTLLGVLEQQAAATYSGPWTNESGSDYSGGRTKYSNKRGASATYTFTGRNVSLVSAAGPERGRARVFVDGHLSATINTHASSIKARRIVWQHHWGGSRTHTIKIVVIGTAGHPRVDVDAFVVLD